MSERLHQVSPHIWQSSYDLSFAPGVVFPTNTTAIVLSSGEVALHSPGPLDDALCEAITSLGRVSHIIAPNLYHHLHIAAASRRFEDATTWCAPGLDVKRDDLDFDQTLCHGAWPPPHWPDDLEAIPLQGAPKLNEVVFYHARDRALIVCDFVMHITHPKGLLTSLVLKMAGTHKRFAQSRLIRSAQENRAKGEEGVRRILSLSIDTVVMAHGDPISGAQTKERLAHALAPMSSRV